MLTTLVDRDDELARRAYSSAPRARGTLSHRPQRPPWQPSPHPRPGTPRQGPGGATKEGMWHERRPDRARQQEHSPHRPQRGEVPASPWVRRRAPPRQRGRDHAYFRRVVGRVYRLGEGRPRRLRQAPRRPPEALTEIPRLSARRIRLWWSPAATPRGPGRRTPGAGGGRWPPAPIQLTQNFPGGQKKRTLRLVTPDPGNWRRSFGDASGFRIFNVRTTTAYTQTRELATTAPGSWTRHPPSHLAVARALALGQVCYSAGEIGKSNSTRISAPRWDRPPCRGWPARRFRHGAGRRRARDRLAGLRSRSPAVHATVPRS